MSTSTPFIDPATLMRIQSLELRARIVVEGFYHGIHRSPFHGFSVEFSEYRPYSTGDDPRHIDWRLVGRTDRYYVKRYEAETNLRCHLLVDVSRSMAYSSADYSKGEYARTAAGTLAYFLGQQRDAVGLIAFDDDVLEYIPPRYRPGHLHRLMVSLNRPESGNATDLGAPIRFLSQVARKRSLVILISDFMAPIEQIESHLSVMRSLGHDIVLIRVTDPAETAFSFEEPVLFEEMESGKTLFVDPSAVREEYLNRYKDHEAALKEMCGDLGIALHCFTTDQPLELTLYEFVTSRLRRGGGSRTSATRPYGAGAHG